MEYLAKIISNSSIAPDARKMQLRLSGLVKSAQPGQFVHLGLGDKNLLLRRPFSIYRLDGNKLEVVYQIIGKGTSLMSLLKPGASLNILGPLGQGFQINKGNQISILVGGGIGIAGLHLLLKRLIMAGKWVVLSHWDKLCAMPAPTASGGPAAPQVHIFIGARSKSRLYCLTDIKKLCSNIHIATEDGSAGYKGLVTELLAQWLSSAPQINRLKPRSRCASSLSPVGPNGGMQIYTCGPSPMISAIRRIALARRIPAQASLESRMACGIGLCRACVCKTLPAKNDFLSKKWRWATVCQEGPVFDIRQLAE